MAFSTDKVLLKVGFYAGVCFAAICLGLCFKYLIDYQHAVQSAVEASNAFAKTANMTDNQQWSAQLSQEIQMYLYKMMLQSCGVVAGLGFGFLGFSLCLLGVEGNIETSISTGEKSKFSASRLSPGVFVLLLATLLIWLCSTSRIPFTFDTASRPSGRAASTSAASAPSADDGPGNAIDPRMPGDEGHASDGASPDNGQNESKRRK